MKASPTTLVAAGFFCAGSRWTSRSGDECRGTGVPLYGYGPPFIGTRTMLPELLSSQADSHAEVALPARHNKRVQSVLESLRQSPYPQLACGVSCREHEGVLTLRGRLPRYYLKQMAQELARRVEGVELVVNRIEVEFFHNKEVADARADSQSR